MEAAEGHICTLKEAQDKLLEELDATRARLRETSNLLTALQVCTSERLASVFFLEDARISVFVFQTHQTLNIKYKCQGNVGATAVITLLLIRPKKRKLNEQVWHLSNLPPVERSN